MTKAPKVSAAQNTGLRDDHDPSDPAQRLADKQEQSQKAAHALHRENEDIRSTSGDPAKKKTGEF